MVLRLIIGAVAVLVLALGAFLIAPSFVPASAIRDVVARETRTALGRELTIGGDASVTLLPNIGVRLSNVQLANAPGFGDSPLMELEELRVRVGLLPLLGGQIVVQELVLVGPKTELQSRADGANNWTFEPQNTAVSTGDASAAPEASLTSLEADAGQTSRQPTSRKHLPESLPLGVALGDVRVVDGAATYFDEASETQHTVSDINIAVSMPAFDAPLAVDGDFAFNDEPMELSVKLSTLESLFGVAETPLDLTFSTASLELGVDGQLVEGEEWVFEGDVSLDSDSLRDLAALVGVTLPESGVTGQETFETLSIEGQAAIEPRLVAFRDATLAFDAIKGESTLIQLDLREDRPRFLGALSLSMLDITPYMPASPQASAATAPSDGPAPLEPWSEDALDFSALTFADAAFELEVEGLKFGEITLGTGLVSLELEDGRLLTELQRLDAYDGALSGIVVLDASERRPNIEMEFTLEGVAAQPFLTDSAEFTRVAGVADMRMEATGEARSISGFMNDVDGGGSFAFTDGEVIGVDLNKAAQAIEEILDGRIPNPQVFEAGDATDFATFTGSFLIDDGIATTSDLSLTNPVVTMGGSGVLNLGRQSVDLRLEPVLIAAPDSDLANIPIPLRVRGPWNSVSTGVDRERSSELVRDYIRSEAEEAALEQINDALRSFFD